jgi:glycosyltransferase involved in cell wall biosynthesis
MGRTERRLVDMFLPVSGAVAVANCLKRDRLPFQIIPNFVPDESECEADGAVDAYVEQLPREDYLLFVGAGRYKGAHVAIQAYAELDNPPPLVMIGSGSLMPSQSPPGVHFFQGWPHSAVMAAWRRSLIGLAPSTCPDACPTVVIEAMTAGSPVIASRIGGVPDLVVDGETGLLIPPGDAGALRSGIRRLLADPALRQRMGRAAQRRVRQFRASAVVPRIEQVYRELIAA